MTLQSEALKLFLNSGGESEFLDRALQSLLVLRRNGEWGGSYDNA